MGGKEKHIVSLSLPNKLLILSFPMYGEKVGNGQSYPAMEWAVTLRRNCSRRGPLTKRVCYARLLGATLFRLQGNLDAILIKVKLLLHIYPTISALISAQL